MRGECRREVTFSRTSVIYESVSPAGRPFSHRRRKSTVENMSGFIERLQVRFIARQHTRRRPSLRPQCDAIMTLLDIPAPIRASSTYALARHQSPSQRREEFKGPWETLRALVKHEMCEFVESTRVSMGACASDFDPGPRSPLFRSVDSRCPGLKSKTQCS